MNKDIREIDKNVTTQTVNEEGYVLYEARCGKFSIEGFAFLEENDYEFTRLPKSKHSAIRQNLLYFGAWRTEKICEEYRSGFRELYLERRSGFKPLQLRKHDGSDFVSASV